MDKELNELIDRYVKGQLTAEEKNQFEARVKQSEAFRQIVEDHVELVDAMVEYGKRADLKAKLESAHDELTCKVKAIEKKQGGWKYWPLTGVAASVAIISVIGTILLTNSFNKKEQEFRELRRVVDRLDKSTKRIEKNIAETNRKKPSGNYAGTCFLISKNGHLITSYHLVKGADSINIENEKFGTLKAAVLYNDPDNDVSVLKIDTTLWSLPYIVESAEAGLAEDVYTLGFPREDVVFGEGAISALSGFNQNPNSYQVSVPVNPGNSGGPLLNNKGNLVGMISGSQTETLGAAFAIKSNVLLEIVSSDTLKNSVTLSKQNTIRNAGRVAQVNQWKDFVFMVRVFKTN
jgi:serine protease Do